MSRAFEEEEVATHRKALLRTKNPCPEVFHHLAVDHAAREAARNLYRREEIDRVGQVEDAAHERRIFVGRLTIERDPALANRLHERRLESARAECCEEAE